MAKFEHKPKPSDQVDEYINSAEKFARPICNRLRDIIKNSDPEITEEWKWGPNYQHNGMVCGFGAFRNHVTLTFFKGSLLQDRKSILVEGESNLHNRSIKFKSLEDIDEKTISAYVKEAVKLNISGKKPEVKHLEIPVALAAALNKNKKLKETFDSLTFTEKKEHIISIRDAKKDETRERRLAKIIELLNSRKG